MSSSLTTREDELFARWAGRLPSDALFISDGVPYPERYEAAPTRVLLLLKEPWSNARKAWDLRQGLREELTKGSTWNNASRWAMALRTPHAPPAWSEVAVQDTASRRAALDSVAVVNVKKTLGWQRTNSGELHSFARDNKAFIREQLALYRPHITLLCGTAACIGELFGADEQSERYEPAAGVPFRIVRDLGCMLRFHHPQTSHATAELLYAKLAGSVLEAHQQGLIPS